MDPEGEEGRCRWARGIAGGQGGAGSAAESTTKRRRGALGPTPQRSRTDKGGWRPPGSTTAQPLKRAEGDNPGKGPVHPVSALLRSPHIEPVDDVIVREPGKLHKAVAEQLDQPRIMGSLPHGVSPGISLSPGDDWCGQVHREHWRLGRWREASPAYFSAQPLGPKLQTPVAQSSTGPPLLSLAL